MSNNIDLRIDNREMLHNKVCTVLRKAILKGDLKPGERLVQTDLADQIGVSRMPVREALRTLELEGLIKMEPHKGAVVREITKEDIREIYELRTLLEPIALKKSMAHFTEQDIHKLENLHKQMQLSDTEELYSEINEQFHKFMISQCESPRLLGFIESVSSGFAQDTPMIVSGQIEKSNREHDEILNSIKQGNQENAAKHLATHISRSGKELLNSLKENNESFK